MNLQQIKQTVDAIQARADEIGREDIADRFAAFRTMASIDMVFEATGIASKAAKTVLDGERDKKMRRLCHSLIADEVLYDD